MTGIRRKYLLITLAAAICAPLSNSALAQTKPKPSSRKAHKALAQKEVAPPTPDPVQPPAPLPPAQLPAVAPQVSYENGQLTIVAQNSTLGDVLRAVGQKTGVEIDVPGNATDRVVGRIGPGAARDVLASLLNGSHFDYVMTGSPQNPAELQRILLMPKSNTPETAPVTQANAAPPQAQPEPEVQPDADASTDDLSQDFNDQGASPDQPAQDDFGQDQQADQQQADQQQQPGTFNGQPNIKSPQQLLQELQQRQLELQRQQQQGGAPQGVPTPAAPNGFPIPPGAQPPQPPQ